MDEDNNSLVASEWVRGGVGMVRRSALPINDPRSWPSLWVKKFGSLEDFPWEELYDEVPTVEDLIRAGIQECPTCGHILKHD